MTLLMSVKSYYEGLWFNMKVSVCRAKKKLSISSSSEVISFLLKVDLHWACLLFVSFKVSTALTKYYHCIKLVLELNLHNINTYLIPFSWLTMSSMSRQLYHAAFNTLLGFHNREISFFSFRNKWYMDYIYEGIYIHQFQSE